jgi:hypothetical protein
VPNVQEQPVAVGGLKFLKLGTGSGNATLDFRFTDFSVGQGTLGTVVDTGASSSYPFTRLSFRDCWLRNGTFSLYPATATAVTATMTNSLVDRCQLGFGHSGVSVNTPFTVVLYNNLFLNNPSSATPGTPPGLALTYATGSSNPNWQVSDDLFAGAEQTLSGSGTNSVLRSYNGFTSGTTNSLGGSNNKTGLTADFVSGPLGGNYYPTSGTGLFTLINAGSRNADVAGLYHHTVKVAANTKEGLDSPLTVDIGYHSVGVNASNQPLDYDGDGVPDSLEDRNGNGSADSGETNWQVSNTGMTAPAALQVFTPLK